LPRSRTQYSPTAFESSVDLPSGRPATTARPPKTTHTPQHKSTRTCKPVKRDDRKESSKSTSASDRNKQLTLPCVEKNKKSAGNHRIEKLEKGKLLTPQKLGEPNRRSPNDRPVKSHVKGTSRAGKLDRHGLRPATHTRDGPNIPNTQHAKPNPHNPITQTTSRETRRVTHQTKQNRRWTDIGAPRTTTKSDKPGYSKHHQYLTSIPCQQNKHQSRTPQRGTVDTKQVRGPNKTRWRLSTT